MEENTIQATWANVLERRNSQEYLESLYARLHIFESKLDQFLSRPDSDLIEINEITGYITSLKKEIAQIEAERKISNISTSGKVLFDNQSILATSSVRRKVSADLKRTDIIIGTR